jgi:hypothetical protein
VSGVGWVSCVSVLFFCGKVFSSMLFMESLFKM